MLVDVGQEAIYPRALVVNCCNGTNCSLVFGYVLSLYLSAIIGSYFKALSNLCPLCFSVEVKTSR